MDKQKVTGTVWVYDTPHNSTILLAHSMSGQPGYVFRGQIDITVEVDPIDKGRAIQDLRNTVEYVETEAADTVRSIMDQIEAIEYKGES
jgi:hypothetical protein